MTPVFSMLPARNDFECPLDGNVFPEMLPGKDWMKIDYSLRKNACKKAWLQKAHPAEK